MKLSHQYASNGLAGQLRNPATGEMLHFNFLKGQKRFFLQAVVGDKHVDCSLTLEEIQTDDPHDEMDLEFKLTIPSGPVGEDLDKIKSVDPEAWRILKNHPESAKDPVRYDIDGSPMIVGAVSAPDDETVNIKEEGPDFIRDPLRSDAERTKEAEEDASRAASAKMQASDLEGSKTAYEKQPIKRVRKASPATTSKTDPTQIPEVEGLGLRSEPKRHVEPWEQEQHALDDHRKTLETSEGVETKELKNS